MGAVVGEKFVLLCSSPSTIHCRCWPSPLRGARMQEGTVALWQMAKTTAAVLALRQAGLPYICVLGHPTVGGVLASYATLGDFIIAEEKATLSFAGDRVVKLTSGGRGVDPAAHDGGILYAPWRAPRRGETARDEVADCRSIAPDRVVS